MLGRERGKLKFFDLPAVVSQPPLERRVSNHIAREAKAMRVEALGQLEAAREARDPQLCEAWAAVLDGLTTSGSAATLRFFEAMLHDGFGWADLPRATASRLEGRAPPPASSSGYAAVAPASEPIPELWVDVTRSVEEARDKCVSQFPDLPVNTDEFAKASSAIDDYLAKEAGDWMNQSKQFQMNRLKRLAHKHADTICEKSPN